MALCPHHWKIGGVSLNSKLWTAKILAEQPELIKQVHKNYFKAGADIILFETKLKLRQKLLKNMDMITGSVSHV